MRATSIAAYRAIQANGLLNARQWEVYSFLFHHGPLTGAEVDIGMRSSDAHKRISELVAARVVACVGAKVNEQSGMRNDVFDVTDHVPAERVRARKPKRPTPDIRQRAVHEIRRLFLCAQMEPSDEVKRMLAWAEGA